LIAEQTEMQQLASEALWLTEKKFFDDNYAVVLIGGHTTIYHKHHQDNNMMSVDTAKDFFCNRTYLEYKKDKRGTIYETQVFAFNKWLGLAETKRFEGLLFDPSMPYGDNGKFWNTWRGWVYASGNYENPAEMCSIYLDHIFNNICNGDNEIYDYVLDWMAQIIQQPEKKVFHSIAIKGEKGCGKSIFVQIYQRLFGQATVEIADSECLTNTFNSLLANRILVYADEAFWSGDKKHRGKLKNLISSDRIAITFKGKDTISMSNYIRIIATTNSDWSAPIEKGERRWVSLRCGNRNLKDRRYFGSMIEQMNNGGYEALMQFLLARDISARDWSSVPETEASRQDMALTVASDNIVAEYLDWCLNSYEGNGADENNFFCYYTGEKNKKSIKTSLFLESVSNFARKRSGQQYLNSTNVAMKLKEIFGRDFRSYPDKSIRYYRFGERETIRAIVDDFYGFKSDCEESE